MKTFALTSLLALVACGDNGSTPPQTDAPPVTPDAPVVPDPDAPSDAPPSTFVPPTPIKIPLSVAGQDQLQSAAPGPGDTFYAAGFATQTLGGTRFVTVIRYTTAGEPDATFGQNGVVTTPIVYVGGTDEIDLAIQPDGKILVSGTTAAPTPVVAGDRDIGVARLNVNGTLDTTFNPTGPTPGVSIISLNTAVLVGATVTAPDASRSIAVDANGIYIHGNSRGLGFKADGVTLRTDTDFTVVKLTTAGIVDTTFGGTQIRIDGGTNAITTGVAGQFRVDITTALGVEANATPRGIKVLPNGSLMVSGYASGTLLCPTLTNGCAQPQPVLYKLTAAGALDQTWNSNLGFFHELVLGFQTEIYNIAVHGDTLTTGGYGKNLEANTTDYISLRFKLETPGGIEARDLTYGTNGRVFFDPSGAMLGSNCRNAMALPNGRTLMTGSTGPGANQANPTNNVQDAVVAFIDADGQLDTKYGTGIHVYPLGQNGGDQFWGSTVVGNKVVVVGWQQGLFVQTEAFNDDSFAVIYDLQP